MLYEVITQSHHPEILETLGVSALSVSETEGDGAYRSEAWPGLAARVAKASFSKCERCWNHLPDVGSHAAVPGLCGRCVSVTGGS